MSADEDYADRLRKLEERRKAREQQKDEAEIEQQKFKLVSFIISINFVFRFYLTTSLSQGNGPSSEEKRREETKNRSEKKRND